MFKSVNVGNTDRVVRILAGLVLVVLPFITSFALWANPVWMWVSIIAGVVLISTGIVRFCPLYRLFGANTCRVNHSS